MVTADDEIKAKITAIEKRLPPVLHSRSAHTDATPSDALMPPDYPAITSSSFKTFNSCMGQAQKVMPSNTQNPSYIILVLYTLYPSK